MRNKKIDRDCIQHKYEKTCSKIKRDAQRYYRSGHTEKFEEFYNI